MDQAPVAACGREGLVEEGRVDAAGRRAALLHEGDGDADGGEAVEEVRGAVERVDQPVAGRISAALLLADHRDVGGGLREQGADRALAGDVDRGDVVAGAALVERGRAAASDPLPHDLAAAERGGDGDLLHLLHGR